MKYGRVWGCAALAVLMNLSMAARAEAEPTSKDAAAPSAPSAPPPDIVRMKDGGLLRGTIAESVPGSFVTIVLLTGETRKIAFSEVDYAGPADAAPSATHKKRHGDDDDDAQKSAQPPRSTETSKPFVTVHGAEANVSFSSTPDAHTLYRRDGTATAFGSNGVGVVATGFSEICTAPCEASLPAGTYTFGVSKPKGVAVEGDQVTLPPGSSRLHADYTDNSGLRVAGWVTFVGGVAIGSALLLDGVLSGGLDCSGDTGECTDKPKNYTLIYAGGALEIGGLLVGLVLINQKDGVSLTVTPGGPESGRRSPAHNQATADRALPKGLTFSGRF